MKRPAPGVPHILVIDDDESVRDGMRAIFQELGWTFDLGASTDDAVAAARRRRPDVLLTDLRLVERDDGISLTAAVRALHPGVPALLVSGDTAPERLSQARAAGIPIVHKPVSADMLLAEIHRLLVMPDPAGPPAHRSPSGFAAAAGDQTDTAG